MFVEIIVAECSYARARTHVRWKYVRFCFAKFRFGQILILHRLIQAYLYRMCQPVIFHLSIFIINITDDKWWTMCYARNISLIVLWPKEKSVSKNDFTVRKGKGKKENILTSFKTSFGRKSSLEKFVKNTWIWLILDWTGVNNWRE